MFSPTNLDRSHWRPKAARLAKGGSRERVGGSEFATFLHKTSLADGPERFRGNRSPTGFQDPSNRPQSQCWRRWETGTFPPPTPHRPSARARPPSSGRKFCQFCSVCQMLRAPQVTVRPCLPRTRSSGRRRVPGRAPRRPLPSGREGPHSPFPSAAPWCARPAGGRPLYSRRPPCWLSAAPDKRFAARRVSAGPAP